MPEAHGGAAFKLAVSPALTAPIVSSVELANRRWASGHPFVERVPRALDHAATVLRVRATRRDGRWDLDGQQTGTLSGATYSGSAMITPTALGTYTYALTCAGTESGFATLNVIAASPRRLPPRRRQRLQRLPRRTATATATEQQPQPLLPLDGNRD